MFRITPLLFCSEHCACLTPVTCRVQAEEKRKREERQAEQAEKLAAKILPVVPHGAVNDRPPAIDAFKKRMQKRLQKVMTHSGSNAKHKGLSM